MPSRNLLDTTFKITMQRNVQIICAIIVFCIIIFELIKTDAKITKLLLVPILLAYGSNIYILGQWGKI